MEYSGAEGKLIYEKNQKQKISWRSPFKLIIKETGVLTLHAACSYGEGYSSASREIVLFFFPDRLDLVVKN